MEKKTERADVTRREAEAGDSQLAGANNSSVVVPEATGISVGAGGKLIVPRENIGTDVTEGSDLDIAALQTLKHRKPHRREWIVIDVESAITTKFLVHKPQPTAIDRELYYVAPALRAPIADELTDVRVLRFYSIAAKAYALWVVNVNVGNSWYDSVATLLRQPVEFFESNAVRIFSDRASSSYRVKFKPIDHIPPWPPRSIEELLGEAIGADHFITSTDHPVYDELISGTELR